MMSKEFFTVKEFEKLKLKPQTNRKKCRKYLITPCAFDIETTTYEEKSYMYVWQFGFLDKIVIGRTWREFDELLSYIRQYWRVNLNNRLIIWVHNFSYEFSFLKFRLKWARKKDGSADIFALTNTRVIKAVTASGFEFRDSYVQSGYSLATLAKNYCKTQKAVGDLDYTILRNSKTPLTDAELGYCINDARILLEYSSYLYGHFPKKIPLTKTGIPRQAIRDNFKKRPPEYQENARLLLRKSFPDEKTYIEMMGKLYAGGYTHANYIYTGDILENVASFDFKSAYPSKCFEPLPWVFRELPVKYFDDALKSFEHIALMIDVTFKGLSTKTTHSIFSEHKAIKGSAGILCDNGRIRCADALHCYLTEYDFLNFQSFYQWDNMEIHALRYSEKKMLPRYVLDEIAEYYELKNSLPKGTPEYAEAKEKLNSIYGMMVTGLFHDNLIFDESTGSFTIGEENTPYSKLIRDKLLLPQWGVWITAGVRYNLLSKLCIKMPEDWVYSDTDSGKILNYKKHLPVIEAYNADILKRNEEIFRTYGYNLGELGIFDFEGVYEKFKTLGAKRYIYQQSGKVYVTCAGLPKDALPIYCKEKNIDIWRVFDDKMLLPAKYTGKLRTKYTNTEYSANITDAFGNAERMTEKSGVALLGVPFELSMTGEYISLVKEYNERNKRIVGRRDF